MYCRLVLEGRRYDTIIDASVIVTVVALGVVAAGLLRSPESTVAERDSSIVSEPIEYPVDIPGCSEVEPPPSSEGEMFMTSSIVQGSSSYDNPAYPWLTSGKAGAMSDAVLAALPDDVSVRLAMPSMSLVFQPVKDYGDDIPEGLSPSTDAMGELERADTSAFASISVRPSDALVPACVAGALDARITQADGTVIDTDDTWFEYDGNRTNFRSATAYHPDGTLVTANLTGSSSVEFPLEPSEMARIVSLTDLRLTVPAPAGSAAPLQDCYIPSQDSGTERDLRADAIDTANDALTTAWQAIPNAPVLDRPIGSLIPGGFGSGVCTDLDVVGTRVGLSISVSGGAELPVARDPYDPENAYGAEVELRTLPDGSVIERSDADIVNSTTSEDGITQLTRSVTVTRPSGVQVSVSSAARFERGSYAPMVLPEPLPFEILDAVAQAPITQWP